jgi:hypothetical protein
MLSLYTLDIANELCLLGISMDISDYMSGVNYLDRLTTIILAGFG